MGRFLVGVEEELRVQTQSRVTTVEEISRLTLDGGGKRLRPALVHLAARATGREFESSRTQRLGAAMEMIHMATLIHDDVIDDAALRRGRPTAFSVYGNTASILGGDFLLAKAMLLLAQDGDLPIIRMVSEAVVELAEGEVRELELRGILNLSKDDHFQVLRMKTAGFIECCCRLGGMIAEASEPEVDALGEFGHQLGIAFQIADDILDYHGDPAKTGKPLATDFIEGCTTLPLIELLPLLQSEQVAWLESLFGKEAHENELGNLISLMGEKGSLAKAQMEAENRIQIGKQSMKRLPESAERDLMCAVAEFVVQRES